MSPGGRESNVCGAPGRHTADLWDKMLDTLLEGGRADLVNDLRGGALRFNDVWARYRTGEWARIPSGAHMRPLYTAVAEWLPTAHKVSGKPLSASHRESIRQAFKALEKLRPSATVADLPGLLRQYRADCERRGIGRTFRKTKNAVQTFLRETQGKRRSILWAEVSDIADVAYERDVVKARTVEQALEIRDALPRPHARIWWTLCTSGMMPDELWGEKWKVRGVGIDIGGTKTAFRRRLVPLIEAPTVPERQYKAFRVALQKVQADLTPYVARRSYSHWLEEAGINPTRRRLYMGHAARGPHEKYPEHEVEPHLVADAALLLGYIGFERPKLEVVA